VTSDGFAPPDKVRGRAPLAGHSMSLRPSSRLFRNRSAALGISCCPTAPEMR
jgi:hypothetical protein